MKILVFGFIPKWAGGKQENGLANVIYNLSLHMSRSNNVVLASLDVYERSLQREELKILGWTKWILLIHLMKYPATFVSYLFYLIKNYRIIPKNNTIADVFFKGIFLHYAIKKEMPEVLHLHEAYSWLYVRLVPAGVKIVLTIHGLFGISESLPYRELYSRLERSCCSSYRISAIFFISHLLSDLFHENYGPIIPRTFVVINAYDDEIFKFIEPKKHEGINLCTIATLQDHKGQKRVIEGLSKSHTNCNYFTIGDGKAETIDYLASYSEEVGVAYTHLGKMKPEEIRETLSIMDYMILPSSSEGFGLVFLEAIACGVPVILPKNLPILKETDLIQVNKNALLLEDYSADSIALTLNQLDKYKFDHKTVSMSLPNISWDYIAKQYLECFKCL